MSYLGSEPDIFAILRPDICFIWREKAEGDVVERQSSGVCFDEFRMGDGGLGEGLIEEKGRGSGESRWRRIRYSLVAQCLDPD